MMRLKKKPCLYEVEDSWLDWQALSTIARVFFTSEVVKSDSLDLSNMYICFFSATCVTMCVFRGK